MGNTFPIVLTLVFLATTKIIEAAGDDTTELRVGFSQLDITPPVGAIMTGPRLPITVGTDDPLLVKTIVVQSRDRTIAIVGLDLVKIRLDLADQAITEASERTGIDRGAIMICPSHNHSSPFIPMGGPNNKEYIESLPGLITQSIEEAHQAMQPARMLIGRSLVYEGHHNRRVITKSDGKALNTWLKKLDDLEQTPQVLGAEGPIDPELWVTRFDAMDGKLLGTLVNFTCHPALHDRRGLDQKGAAKWSADYPGVIAKHLSEEFGEQAVSVFTQGASGNINPSVLFVADWREKAAVFANAAVAAARSATPVESPVTVGFTRRDVEVELSAPEGQRDGAIARLGWRPESFEAAKEMVARMPATRKVPVNAARIGPFAIATNAGELFVEWGLDIKLRSPFPHTVVTELTNDWIGYEPTAKGFDHEGYESLVGVNFVTLEGIQTLVNTAVELLEELWEMDGK